MEKARVVDVVVETGKIYAGWTAYQNAPFQNEVAKAATGVAAWWLVGKAADAVVGSEGLVTF